VSHVRASFLPLHRDAERFKYLAGSELAAGAFLNDVAPEDAAARLRDAGARLRGSSGATTFE
jgi:UDPglucose--hexose-1-phosphate uridylyltransferase